MAKQTNTKQEELKRSKVSQTEFPNQTLEQAERIASAIWEHFAGRGAAPHDIAIALDMSPTSGTWRNLCGSAIAYGLTDGGYSVPQITLTSLGRRIVAPTEEGDDLKARVEALLLPRLQREFLDKYNKAKFPRDDIGRNQLVALGLPNDRAEKSFEILKANGNYAGVLRDTKTGLFVAIDSPMPTREVLVSDVVDEDSDEPLITQLSRISTAQDHAEVQPIPRISTPPTVAVANNRVFITHGKNRKILDQIKRTVVSVGFDPVVSVQSESAAKPVPQKVMDEMKSCGAVVIHVGAEDDGKGNRLLNPNVLIEIGAAMMHCGDRFVLVVEDGIEVPSNLQGLYQSRYTGDSLDFDAGMKIQEALRGLKAKS